MNLTNKLNERGVVLLRGLLDRKLAIEIDRRLRANLERTAHVFTNYAEDANRNVFPISMATAEPSESSLVGRIESAVRGNILDPHFVSAAEKTTLGEIAKPILSELDGFTLRGLDNCYARYEAARPNSAYDGCIHQDAVFDLYGLTAWIALSPCGRDAPALQFIRKKRDRLIEPEARPFLRPKHFWGWQWTRPEYEPGDVVIFDHYTVHGTYLTRGMTKSRTSLDIRFVPH